MAFEFSYHKRFWIQCSTSFESKFSYQVSMDIFCPIVATNFVFSGSEEFVHLVLDFIIPSIDNLPQLLSESSPSYMLWPAIYKGLSYVYLFPDLLILLIHLVFLNLF